MASPLRSAPSDSAAATRGVGGDGNQAVSTATERRGYKGRAAYGHGRNTDDHGQVHTDAEFAESDSMIAAGETAKRCVCAGDCTRSLPLGSPFGPPSVLRLAAPSDSASHATRHASGASIPHPDPLPFERERGTRSFRAAERRLKRAATGGGGKRRQAGHGAYAPSLESG